MYKLTIAVLFALFFIGAPASFRTQVATSVAEEEEFFVNHFNNEESGELEFGENEFDLESDSSDSSDDDATEEELAFFNDNEEAEVIVSEEETLVLPTQQFIVIDENMNVHVQPSFAETLATWAF